MANKHVLNPCPMGGQESDGHNTLMLGNNSIRLVCPMCGKLVSTNKGNKLVRSHNA